MSKSQDDILVDKVFESLHNSSIQTVDPELVFGKIFDFIGFNKIGEDLFRHLVISRRAFPQSKLKPSNTFIVTRECGLTLMQFIVFWTN